MTKAKIFPLNFGGRNKSLPRPFDYEILRSKRKTLAIHIKHRKVQVRCPLRVSKAEVEEFVSASQAWIERRLREESLRDKEALRIENGAKIFYHARERTLVFKEGHKQSVRVVGDEFIIQGHKLTTAKAQIQLKNFLIAKASESIFPRARGLARHLGVEHKITAIKLRKTKSKWGHCTSTGILQFNWLIMLAPNSIIDYMITHEVCHLLHMDHSQRFWNQVKVICPDCDYYIDWLKKHEHRFWF